MSEFLDALGEMDTPFTNDIYLQMLFMEAILMLGDDAAEAGDPIREQRLAALERAYRLAMAFCKEGMLTKIVGQMLKKK